MAADDARALLFDADTYRIRGAVFEVYRLMGSGFLEAVCQECLEREFQKREIPYVATPSLRIEYDGVQLKARYVPDFVCFEAIVVELKAVSQIAPEHRAQLIHYVRATRLRVGLLANFGAAGRADIVRVVV
jgi:GxxExxY protein